MKIRFLRVAQQELDEAVDYYNREVPGLGKVTHSARTCWRRRG